MCQPTSQTFNIAPLICSLLCVYHQSLFFHFLRSPFSFNACIIIAVWAMTVTLHLLCICPHIICYNTCTQSHFSSSTILQWSPSSCYITYFASSTYVFCSISIFLTDLFYTIRSTSHIIYHQMWHMYNTIPCITTTQSPHKGDLCMALHKVSADLSHCLHVHLPHHYSLYAFTSCNYIRSYRYLLLPYLIQVVLSGLSTLVHLIIYREFVQQLTTKSLPKTCPSQDRLLPTSIYTLALSDVCLCLN